MSDNKHYVKSPGSLPSVCLRYTFRAMRSLLVAVLSCSTFAFCQLSQLPDLSDATSHRVASNDKSGGNNDWIPVAPGATVTLADLHGAGSIRHIWFTINAPSPNHLRELVLRMYWDGETQPSVEVPIGDFFGTGFTATDNGLQYHSWQSLPITVQDRALNSYFEMPFATSARITLTNDGSEKVENLYYHVDYQQYPDARRVQNQGRFHAQWNHQHTRANTTCNPECKANTDVNLDGRDNYVFMRTTGRGQYVGTILNIFGNSTGWWGEGDDMFFIDQPENAPTAAINGTGLEDYFNNAWSFQQPFNYSYVGYSEQGNKDWTGSHTMYRFHIPDPIYFQHSLRATIEHGHANTRSDDYTSVAFWYQTEPHQPLIPLPPLADRLPTRFWQIQKLPKNLPN